ncbi:ATP binding protein [Pseudohyphozyma bogoriensis]|nr:ATP binding protein [Pseudohyphozyma bogoriensis]
MPFGQLVIGPPGSGKTTYCYGLHQFYTALERPILIVNLDPAASTPPYPAAVSISSLISLKDAMDSFGLGPNGAMLYCLEYLEKNVDWLEEELEKALVEGGWGERREEAYIVFDTPGQVELSTDHTSLKNVVEGLQKKGWRLAAVHLTDAHHITDASKYIALLLLSLRTMLQLELPHVNVLSKVDLLGNAGDLPFNLEYYTEVQDLSRLLPLLEEDPLTKRFSALNEVICEVVEDFGLVSFETLCVEDKDSMMRLTRVIDQALGYVSPTSYAAPHDHDDPDHDHDHDHSHAPHAQSHDHAPSVALDNLYYTQTVQEKWVDHPSLYAAHEREKWKAEGDRAIEEANERSKAEAVERLKREAGNG